MTIAEKQALYKLRIAYANEVLHCCSWIEDSIQGAIDGIDCSKQIEFFEKSKNYWQNRLKEF